MQLSSVVVRVGESSRGAEKERRRQQRVEREWAAQRAERCARAHGAIVVGGVER